VVESVYERYKQIIYELAGGRRLIDKQLPHVLLAHDEGGIAPGARHHDYPAGLWKGGGGTH